MVLQGGDFLYQVINPLVVFVPGCRANNQEIVGRKTFLSAKVIEIRLTDRGGAPISDARLERIPTAERTADEQREWERLGG